MRWGLNIFDIMIISAILQRNVSKLVQKGPDSVTVMVT